MKLSGHSNHCHALTLQEVLVVVAVLFAAMFFLLPALARSEDLARIKCVNNLKQVGLAYNLFAKDHDGRFPYGQTNTLAFQNDRSAWVHFLTLSNELGSATRLTCPADRERVDNLSVDFSSRTNIGSFGLQFKRNAAISYWVGLNADVTRPVSLLAGDRNLTTNSGKWSGSVLTVTSSRLPAWTKGIHVESGDVVLADGSVQQFNTRSLQAHTSNYVWLTNRLLMPMP